MSTNTFLAVMGTILVVLIGINVLQKVDECHQKGGVACCFGARATVCEMISAQYPPVAP